MPTCSSAQAAVSGCSQAAVGGSGPAVCTHACSLTGVDIKQWGYELPARRAVSHSAQQGCSTACVVASLQQMNAAHPCETVLAWP
jgi:hypothetical protein